MSENKKTQGRLRSLQGRMKIQDYFQYPKSLDKGGKAINNNNNNEYYIYN